MTSRRVARLCYGSCCWSRRGWGGRCGKAAKPMLYWLVHSAIARLCFKKAGIVTELAACPIVWVIVVVWDFVKINGGIIGAKNTFILWFRVAAIIRHVLKRCTIIGPAILVWDNIIITSVGAIRTDVAVVYNYIARGIRR
ncbi:hypothetical protein ACHAXA_010387 [Cyclostephanos tholiformis]|uniref:Uncharacterized protein n=1 Tax=Cyclostephanos tholiformis TaxID=382380 RepID=A0ABD3RDM4_9STRA